MQKLVTVNNALTPAGKVAFAEETLGIRVTDPSNRFNPGTLAGRITAGLEAACLILLSPGKLIAVDCGGIPADAAQMGGLVGNGLGAGNVLFSAVADVGSGRSRELVVDETIAEITEPSINVLSGDAALLSALLLPEMPQWSAAGALSAIYDELQGRTPAQPFVAVLNQFDGTILVLGFDTDAHADAAAVAAAGTSQAGIIQSAFDLSDPAAPPAGVAGPVWG